MAADKITPNDLKDLRKAMVDLTNAVNNSNVNGGGKGNGKGNKPNKVDDIKELEKRLKKITGNDKYDEKEKEKIRKEIERKKRIRDYGYDKEAAKAEAKAEKWNKAAGIANAISQIGNEIINIITAFGEKDIALRRALLEKQTKIIEIGIERQSKITSQGSKAIVSGFSKNAVDMAYEATQMGYDLTKTSFKTAMDLKIAEKTYAKNVASANLEFSTSLISSATVIGAAIGTAIAPGVGTAVGAIIGAAGGLIGNAISKIGGLDIKRQELEIQKQEAISKATQGYLEQMENFAKPWDELHKQTTDFVLKINDAGLKFGATIGYTGDNFKDTFASTMIHMQKETLSNGSNLAKMFGKEAEKIPEYMDSYIASSGRAVNMSAEDAGNVMATGRLFGMSGAESANLYGAMNVFNTSISSASDSMGIMYHQITRMGLSSKKFGKDLVQNLKMAEKYNFKGGVENMMKLTKWAQQTRFNLNSAASFADSIMNDSLSGALEKSAKLQVLGGSAAMYSDPLGMLYDAGADVGNMAQRMAGMFNDITGTFNKKTGETDFSWYENRMIAARAQALGMDAGEVKNMIRQNQKQGVIDKVLKGSGLDKEDKLAIGNRATYNKKLNRWEVTDIHGETHDITEYGREGGPDINDLLPADTQESMLVVAEKSLTHLERLDNTVYDRMVGLGETKEGTVYKTVDEQRDKLNNFYEEYKTKIESAWEASNQYSKDMLDNQIKIMEIGANNIPLLKGVYTAMSKASSDFILGEGKLKDFSEAVDHAKISVDELAKWIAQKFPDTKTEVGDQTKAAAEANKTYNEAAKLRTEGKKKEAMVVEKGADAVRGASIGMSSHMHFDGYGSANGKEGMTILGASNVKSIHDGAVKTSKNDQYLAAETGGPIDILLKQILPGLKMLVDNSSTNGSSSGTANINFGGKIELSQNGSTLNLVEMLKNDPAAATKFITLLTKMVETNSNGKPSYSYKMF